MNSIKRGLALATLLAGSVVAFHSASVAHAGDPSACAIHTATCETQSVTIRGLSNTYVGASAQSVSASASSGLPVALSDLTPDICTLSSSWVSMILEGTCTIQATQTGGLVTVTTGDGNSSFYYEPASATTSIQVGSSLLTSTTLLLASPTVSAGQGETLTAQVGILGGTGGAAAPGGRVTFMDGSTTLGSATLNAATGVATLTTGPLTGGQHTFMATYTGDGTYGASTATSTVTVVPAASITTLTTAVGRNPSSLTLATTVSGPQGVSFTPTGTVTFWDNGNIINTRPLTNGTSSYIVVNYPNWTGGTHQVWVTYSGDSTFTSSKSAKVGIQAGQGVS